MLLTEEQARAKWCPHAAVVQYAYNEDAPAPAPSGNRELFTTGAFKCSNSLNGAALCIASECMAWRWDASIQELPTMDFWLRTDDKTLGGVEVKRSEARGFCGLAGQAGA